MYYLHAFYIDFHVDRKRHHEESADAIPGLDLVAMEVDEKPVIDDGKLLRNGACQ